MELNTEIDYSKTSLISDVKRNPQHFKSFYCGEHVIFNKKLMEYSRYVNQIVALYENEQDWWIFVAPEWKQQYFIKDNSR